MLFTKGINILLVEDNPADQNLTLRAFRKARFAANINIASDGNEALDYLYKSRYSNHKEYVFPDLILLDVNMPGMNGIEFLKKIKKIEDFAKIPVIILTVSEHERDILETYELGVSAYIRKPVQADNFINVISSLQNFVLELKVRNINSEPFIN